MAFSLGFAQSREMPNVAFFVCQNRAQDYFWKPEYQSHANGTTGIAAVYLSSPASARDAALVEQDVRWEVSPVVGGFKVVWFLARATCLTPQAIGERDLSLECPAMSTPVLAGMASATEMIYGKLSLGPRTRSRISCRSRVAGNAPPPATRKLLASLRPDINDAWSAETPNTSTKVAGTLPDVETTGNLRRKRR